MLVDWVRSASLFIPKVGAAAGWKGVRLIHWSTRSMYSRTGHSGIFFRRKMMMVSMKRCMVAGKATAGRRRS